MQFQNFPLETLELLYAVWRYLPISDCQNLGRVNRFCHSLRWNWTVWAWRTHDEYQFPVTFFQETTLRDPLQRYREIQAILRIGDGTALKVAATKGNLALVKFMLSQNRRYLNAATTLAAQQGYRDIVEYLIEAGAEYPDYVLREACRAGQLEIVRDLQTYVVSPEIWNDCLIGAARQGYTEVVRYLYPQEYQNPLGLIEATQEALRSTRETAEIVEILISTFSENQRNDLVRWAQRNQRFPRVRQFLDSVGIAPVNL
jgi:hypothetical protein